MIVTVFPLLSSSLTRLSCICFPVPTSCSPFLRAGSCIIAGARDARRSVASNKGSLFFMGARRVSFRNLFVVLIHSSSYSFAPEERTRREKSKSDVLARRSLLLKKSLRRILARNICHLFFSFEHFRKLGWKASLSRFLTGSYSLKPTSVNFPFEKQSERRETKKKRRYQERFPK